MKNQFVIAAGLAIAGTAVLVGCATGLDACACCQSADRRGNRGHQRRPRSRIRRRRASRGSINHRCRAACTEASRTGKPLDDKLREVTQAATMASVKYPADGKYLGDWKRGEAIAQNGRGLQFSDAPGAVAGGNCYACHQIDKAEIAHGNIGPTLWNYGKTAAKPNRS